MIRVGVSGAAGRMGRAIATAIAASDSLVLHGLYAPGHEGEVLAEVPLSVNPEAMAGADVIVEVTRPDVVMRNVIGWKELGCHAVVGTSGFDEDRIASLRQAWGEAPVNCLVVPNFSIGAVLMMQFAERAAPHFAAAEIIELHHDRKLDAPSGTAQATASRLGRAQPEQRRAVDSVEEVPGVRGGAVEGIPVHSVRLPGLLAHQEVLLGNPGELLTIRHDSMSVESFMPGVMLAIRSVSSLRGVNVGLDALI
ncbi:MAG: 4-hydroxy-tetrahydrodipicolinate reductase [Acidimicrobiia bacterium]|nr:4-hydroxy-tetrahydrodipicolinate reductase [Acidimicrobiia bacterium]MDH4308864.1 4-hydroxy-tetrahydrodipicolinate reductase [Acidimicrobiia bacterium]MDH5293794.1 4-hydroxy-tetrahydrodipicolinate reductase [Acidimicrobiia bacterium]